MLLRLAVSTSDEPLEDCPDIADKLTLRFIFCFGVAGVVGVVVRPLSIPTTASTLFPYYGGYGEEQLTA
jgi:hypothetical protein